MRKNLLIGGGVLAALLLARNIWVILTQLPDEAFQGAIFRIIFFHVPAAFTCFLCFLASLIAGLVYLKSKNLNHDAFGVRSIVGHAQDSIVIALRVLISPEVERRI
ncbi:MAG TPA: hypothetical protein PKJ41_21580 [Bryobacteraceae bacterium]|nr:hypothetical protein [Bryobacteraceae bacterium]